MNRFLALPKWMALIALAALVGCQTASMQQGQFALPQFQPMKLTAPAAQTANELQAALAPAQNPNPTSVPASNATAALAARQIPGEAAPPMVVALPSNVPAPSLRATAPDTSLASRNAPFRVPGESANPKTVLFASLGSDAAVPSRRASNQSNGLVGPVRKSRQRVAQLTKRHGARYAKRRARYEPLVIKHAKAAGVPVKLAMAVVHVESSFRSKARGAAGEIGLMQVMPATARYMGYKGSMRKLYNPETNLRVGMSYLAKAHRLGRGDLCNVILKYNAGHGAKRMNSVSRRYCKRIRRLMAQGV